MSLRGAVIVVLAGMALAALAASAVAHCPLWIPLLAWSLLGIVLLVFERGRYRPEVSAQAQWRPTGERFTDPTTGEKVAVVFDPQTGRRDYRPLP
jgi:membrane protein implicated in regulation of membrane protease activity